MTFFDNHDITRGLFEANEDVEKYKLALTILLATRGIPQLFYGSEIGMVGDEKHGNIRSPFPGGFEDDSRNAFEGSDRSDYENDIFEFTKKLLQLRKSYKSLSKGKLIHFYPFDNTYVYFRETKDESTMIIVNGNEEDIEMDLTKYSETLAKTQKVKNIKTDEQFDLNQSKKITIKSKSAEIFLLINN